MAASLSGKEFVLDSNVFDAQSVIFDFQNDNVLFTLKTKNKPDILIKNGINHWITEDNYKPEVHSLFSLRRIDFNSKVAASASWKDGHTLILTWRFIETVHGDQLICTFNEDKVNIKFRFSVADLQNKEDERTDLNGTSATVLSK